MAPGQKTSFNCATPSEIHLFSVHFPDMEETTATRQKKNVHETDGPFTGIAKQMWNSHELGMTQGTLNFKRCSR